MSLPKEGYPLTDTREIHIQVNYGPNAWEVEIDDTRQRIATHASGPAKNEKEARDRAYAFVGSHMYALTENERKPLE